MPDDCKLCGGTGRVSRPATADHILTDTKPWRPCPNGCPPISDSMNRLVTYGLLGAGAYRISHNPPSDA